MQRYTTTCGLQFEFYLKHSRRKTIGFYIRPSGLEIRAPRGIRAIHVQRAIENKKNWLQDHLHALKKRQHRWLEPKNVWRKGGVFPFFGTPMYIHFAACTRPYTRPHTPLHLYIPPSSHEQEVYQHCKSWLQAQARHHLAARLEWWAQHHQIRYRRFTLGWSRQNWGWCKSDGSIMLNWRLIYYPLHLIDYVATHELTHIAHMHHGPDFWQALKTINPDYEAAKKELSLYHPACIPNFITKESP